MRTQLASTSLVTLLSLLGAGVVFTSQANAALPAPVADVYVQTSAGVNVYSVNSAGQMTLVPGSPFPVAGQMEAVRGGSFLLSVGTYWVHVYRLESDGGVGPQVSQINTQSYGGAQCGPTTGGGSVLDHSGQYFSLQLYGAEDSSGTVLCSAWQTYKLGTNGQLTFLGDAVNSANGDHNGAYAVGLSTYSSNDLFAYGVQNADFAGQFTAYKRASAGDLIVNSSFTEKDPTPNPTDSNYAPVYVAADPAGHLAAVLNMPFGPACCSTFQLGSYTINNSTGAIQSTNTYSNMPTVHVYPTSLAMSWAGNLAAVGGTNGIQVFHFNGAAPATADGGVLLPNVEIDKVAWDKSNHLFALSYRTGEVYVYTATSGGMTAVARSPFKAGGAYGLIGIVVVPK